MRAALETGRRDRRGERRGAGREVEKGREMTIAGDNRLTDLAERIRSADQRMAAASREAAELALEAGRLLIEAKAECRHGQWLPFLERAGMAERQAQRLMTLARSGLKTDTVSDLGIRGALEMAAKRKLPKPGEVLIVSIGEPVGRPQILPLDGEVAAYVFAQPGDESRYHMVSWRDHPPDAALAASMTATRRAAPADRPEAIFSAVDVALDWRQSEMRFTVVSPGDDIAVKAAKLHEIALEDPE